MNMQNVIIMFLTFACFIIFKLFKMNVSTLLMGITRRLFIWIYLEDLYSKNPININSNGIKIIRRESKYN